MALFFEIWRSTTGLSDSAFTLIATLPDAGSGFTHDDSTLPAGTLGIYRARRYDDAADPECQYSDWSPLRFARAPYPIQENNMADELAAPLSSAETEAAIAIEHKEGWPVEVDDKFDYVSGSPERTIQTARSRALRNNPARFKKRAPGMASFGGTLVCEPTPEGAFATLLVCALGTPTTSGAGPYRHRFINKFGQKPATLCFRRGFEDATDIFSVFPGTRVRGFELGMSAEQEGVLEFSADLVALDELFYDAAADVGIDTATPDPLANFSMPGSILYIGGVETGEGNGITFRVGKGVAGKRILNGTRGAARHKEGLSDVAATINAYFDSMAAIERLFGQTPGSATYPMALGDDILTTEIKLTMLTVDGEELTVCFPDAQFEQVGDPVPAEGGLIMQAIEVIPYHDDATNTDFWIELLNGLTNAQMIAAGTPLAEIPVSRVKKYPFGVASGVPTTTEVIAAANAQLSAVDDAYNGRTVYFTGNVTAALAGATSVVDDYVGATRTFTLDPALGSAPAAGDIFYIL